MILQSTKIPGAPVLNMLSIIATPIGNLEDITLRAINALSNADLVLAEDTRVTRVLLERYNIKKDILSYHQHSGFKKLDHIIELLRSGKNLALVTDAGTPGISDPGGYLVSETLKAIPELKVVPIPGPNAAVAALSVSGFPADEFVFLGFPPHKKGRQTFFKRISEIESTIVFYESKHRILKTLEQISGVSKIGGRDLVIAREITKQFETIYRGKIEDVSMKLRRDNILGEFVIVINKK